MRSVFASVPTRSWIIIAMLRRPPVPARTLAEVAGTGNKAAVCRPATRCLIQWRLQPSGQLVTIATKSRGTRCPRERPASKSSATGPMIISSRWAMNELISPASASQAGERAASAIAAGYMSGFGNSFETEALPGALPLGRNSPQKVNYGLYAEQLSGSPFTAPQAANQRTWLYRIRPTVRHTGRFARIDKGLIRTAPERDDSELAIGQLRWGPVPIP